MHNCIVIHYSEVGIKKKNRSYFEDKLISNIRNKLDILVSKVFKRYGSIICELPSTHNNEIEEEITNRLKLLPGISHFSFAVICELDVDNIKEKALEYLKTIDFESYKVETKRSNKQFPLKSPEMNKALGEHIYENMDKSVDLKNPQIIVYLEIGEKEVFLFTKKIKSVGGLPVTSGGKLMCSLSGGIDSPVAAYLMMKRGCEVVFVHIQNNTLTNKQTQKKIEDLCKQLTHIQLNSKLYIVPFSNIQKQIIMDVPAKYRMIIYRRFMMKLINNLADKENSLGVITGDSIGQVASQTVFNINCIYDSSKIPVISPLIGLNKLEIVEIAKQIDTYRTSIMPYPDCCSFMIAQHPETRGELNKIIDLENNISNKEELIQECIEKLQVIKYKYKSGKII